LAKLGTVALDPPGYWSVKRRWQFFLPLSVWMVASPVLEPAVVAKILVLTPHTPLA
jgi:hypothetical protein